MKIFVGFKNQYNKKILRQIYAYLYKNTFLFSSYKNIYKTFVLAIVSFIVSSCSLDAVITDLSESLGGPIQVQLSTLETIHTSNSASTIPVDLIFSSNVENLDESSIQVTGGTIVPGSLSGSGKNYTMQITPLGDGVVEINFPSQNVVVSGSTNPKVTNSSSVSVVVDTTYPTVILTTSASSPTTATSLPVTITFSEPIEGLTISDFSITGGGASITSLTGSGSVYNLQILPVLAASIEIELPANTVTDLVGNRNYASNKLTIVYDNTVPTPTLSTAVTSPTNLTTIPVAITFAGVDITGLQLSDFTVANGVLNSLTGSGSSYSFNVTPSGGGAVSIQLPANTVVNALNTANSASNILSLNVDYTVPTLNITGPNPTSGNNLTNFEWTVTYSGHDAISLVAGNVTLNTSGVTCVGKTVSGSGATRTVTVSGCTGDGTVGITVAAGTASDLAGNQSAAATSSNATVDNTGPTLNITGPVPTEGNSLDSFVWTLTYADHSAITLADADVNIVSTGSVANCAKAISSSGNPRTVTLSGCTGNGTVKVTVAANTAADALGNQVGANNSALDATVDNTAPTISIGSVNPSTGNSNTNFEWVVTYGDANAVTLASGNVSITGLGNTAGCVVSIENPVGQSQRTVRIHGCTQSGSMGISIVAGTASDVAGNFAPAASSVSSATIDSSTFTATLASVSSTVNNLTSIPVTVAFSDTTSDFTAADLNLVNASISGFTGSGANYSFNLIPSSDGTVSVNIPANVAVNSFATQNIASNTLSFTVDTIKPTLAIVGPTPTQGNSTAEFVWTINYAGVNNAISLAAGNVTIGGTATAGCLKTVEGTGLTTRTVKVTGCTGNGTLNITLAANTATDLAGNQTDASSVSSDATVDNLGPGLAVSSPNNGYGNNATSFIWTLTYTDYSTISLTAADITIVTTGTVNSCTKAVGGSGSNRTVTITNCLGDGTVKFDIAANTAVDASGNQAGANTTVTVANVDNTPPTLDITGPTPSSGNNSSSFEWTLSYNNYFAPALTISAADISMVYTGTASGCTKSLSGSGAIRTVTLTNCTGDGTVKIEVAAGTAADGVGNSLGAHTTASAATLDNTAPTLNIAGPSPTLGKNGTSFVYTVNYSGASSVSLSSVTLIGTDNAGCGAAITGSGTASRTVTITGCTGNGTVGFTIPSGSAQDTYGNLAGTATSGYATVDNQAPTITIGTPTPLYGKSTTTFEWLITYTGADTITLVAANVSLTGTTTGCAKNLASVSAGVYKVTATGCSGNGSLGISIVGNTAQDSVGNQSASATGSTVTVDNVAPTIASGAPSPTRGNSLTSFSWIYTYSGADTITLADSDVTVVTTGTVSNCTKAVTGSGNTRTVTFTGCTGDGTVKPSIAAGSGQDYAGNVTVAHTTATTATVDNTPPTISIGAVSPTTGDDTTTFVWTVSYTGATTVSLTTTDITLGGAAAGCTVAVNGSGTSSRTVELSGCAGSGSLTISILSGSAVDNSTNVAPAVGPSAAATVQNVILASFTSAYDLVEKGTGTNAQTFTVQLSGAASQDITVNYNLTSFTNANNPSDYDLTSGTVLIPAGQTTANITYSYYGGSVSGSRIIQPALTQAAGTGVSVAIGGKQMIRRTVASSATSDRFVQVDMGDEHACGITENGVLKCWGRNYSGQIGDVSLIDRMSPVVVDGAVTYQKVAVGVGHTCGITTAGVLKCWGDNDFRQLGDGSSISRWTPVVIDSGTQYSEVTAGRTHSCGITTAGVLKCWGYNSNRAVGDGSGSTISSPVIINSGTAYSAVSAGLDHTCGITTAGVLKCWGTNDDGELGDGSTTRRPSPVDVDSSNLYQGISAGYNHSCGIMTSGALKCWGNNWSSELGDGTTNSSLTPVLIDSGESYLKISAGRSSSCGVTSTNVLKCWGSNLSGTIGSMLTDYVTLPTVAESGVAFDDIKVGDKASCGITSDGILLCTGENVYGVLGGSGASEKLVPTDIASGGTYSSFNTTGYYNGCRVTTAGELQCWGLNTYGQLGDGTTVSKAYPVTIGTGYQTVVMGSEFACALKTSGALYCWGKNQDGRTGTNSAESIVKVPTLVDSGVNYQAISVGRAYHGCGITTAGVMKCWGWNPDGRIGDGTLVNKFVPTVINSGVTYQSVSVGDSHSCGVTTANVLKCWGGNNQNQIGDGTSTGRTSPVVVDSGTNYQSVFVGSMSSCGITTTGILKCWGYNGNSNLGDGGTTNLSLPTVIDSGVNYQSVGFANYATCGITSSNALKCWGYNNDGTVGDGTKNTVPTPVVVDSGVSYSKITGGGWSNCGITSSNTVKCWGDNSYNGFGDGIQTKAFFPISTGP